ncbi:VQ motif protein [Medicago truncatula]|nr:VQ motif protein [Medicago truncatula]
MLGVNNHVMKGKKQSKKNKKEVKVTYISSPMKVKTSASNFRALVQELTGQDSNVADMFVEVNDFVHVDDVQNQQKNSIEQWSSDNNSSEGFMPDYSTWMKLEDDYNLRSSMEPLNGQLQYDFLSFDMI